MKRKILALMFLLSVLGLTACGGYGTLSTTPTTRVVTQITVQSGDEIHQYISADSLRLYLTYLRHLDPYGRPAEDPESIQGSAWDITVTYSDGSSEIYRQKDDRYFLDGDGQWKNIDESKALALSKLFHLLPSEIEHPQSPAKQTPGTPYER